MADLKKFWQSGPQVKWIDNGDGTWSPQVSVSGVTIDPGDLQIGAVEIKDADSDTRAQVDATEGVSVTQQSLSSFRSIDLDETEEEVKATPGVVHGYYFANLATATRFIKFYDGTAASVIVGTTVPKLTIPVPGNLSDDVAGHIFSERGVAFAAGIVVAATTGIADADVGAPGANEVVLNVFYR